MIQEQQHKKGQVLPSSLSVEREPDSGGSEGRHRGREVR